MDRIKYPKFVGGFDKHWIWKDEKGNSMYSLSCDYLQKIMYCIAYLNDEIRNLAELSMKDVVYIIVLIDWLSDAVYRIKKLLPQKVNKKIAIEDDADTVKSGKYFDAVRSFIVAHPLNTDRHEAYGLVGDLICADVRSQLTGFERAFGNSLEWLYLGVDGLKKKYKRNAFGFFSFGI